MDIRSRLQSGGALLLCPAFTLIDDQARAGMALVIEGGQFSDLGPAAEVIARHPQLLPVELPGRLLMPGFIDTHHHLTQSFGKAISFGEPSEIFRRIWVPLEQHLDVQALETSALLAALESLRGGFTTVCDAGTRSVAGLRAIESAVETAGLRCVLARTCNDAGSSEAESTELVRLAERHLQSRHPSGLIHPSLAVSIPEAGSDRMLGQVAALCRESGALLQIHVNEHLASVERSLVARGLRPLEVLHRAGALGPQLLAAHATLVTPAEIGLLRDTDTAVSYNPVASSWKGNAVAPALQMFELGIRIGLGTDGTRSDAFRLLDAAETAQRLVFGLPCGDFSMGAGWTWLAMATAQGARAARLEAITGELRVGLAADCLLIDLEVPELAPSWDLPWELVRLANRDQIEAVLVAGRLRLWRGWPLDWDARALMERAREQAGAAVAAAPIQRIHPSSSVARAQSGTAGPAWLAPSRSR
jgi:cytosine/adenosine deaminase-related metal-dependent hydrolase